MTEAGVGRLSGLATDYDAIATDYDADRDNPFNALYERPASLALLPSRSGARVLDAECGSGLHAAEMISRGATVVGVDASAELLALARQRSPHGAEFHRANLGDPLPFLADASFDAVLCALVQLLRDRAPHRPQDEGRRTFDVQLWRRPLTEMVAAMEHVGSRIDRLVEPAPVPECEDRSPNEWRS